MNTEINTVFILLATCYFKAQIFCLTPLAASGQSLPSFAEFSPFFGIFFLLIFLPSFLL